MFLAAAMAAFGAWAETETVGGYTWTYRINGDTAEIYGYDHWYEPTDIINDSGHILLPSISPTTGAVTIPSMLGGKPVTSIGNYAFYNCSGLASVTIPNSVTSIGASTFYNCSGLTSVTIPDTVTSIGSYAFSGCNGLTSVTIPNSVTNIGYGAFYKCNGLTSVTIPNSVTSIGEYAFCNCSGLMSVTIPNSVTSIGNSAFYNCSGLMSISVGLGNANYKSVNGLLLSKDGKTLIQGVNGDVTIPNSVTSIGGGVFYNCSGLTSVTIGNGVTSIGNYAFKGCSGLTSVTIPNSVTNIGGSAFYNCSGLASVTIPNSVTSIGHEAFYNCSGLTSVRIPNSVTSIGDRAFSGCSGLTSVTIPNSVTSIGNRAFSGCSGLTSVTIPDCVQGPCHLAFYGCDALEMLILPAAFIPPHGFIWLFKEEYYESDDLHFWGPYYRGNIPSSLRKVVVVGNIGSETFLNCSTLENIIIAGTAESIGARAFKDCIGLKSVSIPDSVTSIGEDAFSGCTGLKSVTIPQCVCSDRLSSFFPDSYQSITDVVVSDGVSSIGAWAFYACSGLKNVKIGESVTTIRPYAFFDCRGLESVTIPYSVTRIWAGAFGECSGLKSVRLPGHLKNNLDASVFDGCPDYMEIIYYDPFYTLVFHRNDASDEKTEAYDFDYGVNTRLPTLNSMGWARRGFDFLGWAKSTGNAARGTIWAADWGIVSTAAEIGETRDVYASWALKDGFYAIQFIRNDGAGTWRTVGFPYGEKTRMPTLAKGLGWGRRGYQFNGWAQTAANANNGVIWKGDWGYVATPVAAGSTLMVYASWTLKPGYYQIRFNKNDGSGKWRTLGFGCGASAKLNTIAGLGWEIPGKTFKGWGSNAANAADGKVWKTDGAWIKDVTAEGKTLSIYAIWE